MQRTERAWEIQVKRSFHNYTICMMIAVIILCTTLVCAWITHFPWIVYIVGLCFALALEYCSRKWFERTMAKEFATVETHFWSAVTQAVERNTNEE